MIPRVQPHLLSLQIFSLIVDIVKDPVLIYYLKKMHNTVIKCKKNNVTMNLDSCTTGFTK